MGTSAGAAPSYIFLTPSGLPHVHRRVGVLSALKALAMTLLASKNPTAGWQVTAGGLSLWPTASPPQRACVRGAADDNLKTRSRTVEGDTSKSDERITALMNRHQFPVGLARQLISTSSFYPIRFWIVDNSGSMDSPDGQRLVVDGSGGTSIISATRWQELASTVTTVAAVSHSVGARTEFYQLNPSSVRPLVISGTCEGDVAKVSAAIQDMEARGTTPLTSVVERIIAAIEPSVDRFVAKGEQICIVIATDGLPDNNKAFKKALARLLSLPVWIVVRLCTDEKPVVDYYNHLDRQLDEAALEVLDDILGESQKVGQANRWLTYGPPLHLAREFGLRDRLFDKINERPLLPTEVKTFCELLLGCAPLPEPELELKAFLAAVESELEMLPKVFDPPRNKMSPWIKTSVVKAHIRAALAKNPVEAAVARLQLFLSGS